jgi:endonuclease/exonuclease/phosphatase family metal-dependent hydrolase
MWAGNPMNRMKLLYLSSGTTLLAACITASPSASPNPPSASPVPTRASVPTLSPTSPSATPAYPTPVPNADDAFLTKDPGSLRVMTYNVNWDSIFPDDDPQNHDFRAFNRVDSFRRILRAIKPDVICLQEINDRRGASDLAEYIALAAGDSQGTWHAVHRRDDVIASRFDLLNEGYELHTGSVLASLDQAAALVDLPDSGYPGMDLYMICSHFKSGGGIADISLRQRQADVIMAQVRDFETPGGNLDLPAETPFVILGDFNAYGTDPALHVRTLTTGDIGNETSYGVDLRPDWDGTSLEDAMPSHNGQGVEFYTWRDDAEPFDPWPLDRVFYSDSVLQIQNAFVLDTTTLGDDILSAHGLLRDDVVLDSQSGNYDHLPIVVDFQLDAGE